MCFHLCGNYQAISVLKTFDAQLKYKKLKTCAEFLGGYYLCIYENTIH